MSELHIVNDPAFAEIIAPELKTPKLKNGENPLMLLQSEEKPQ